MTRSSCEWGGAYKNASALEGEGGRVRSTLLTSESAVLGHHGVPGRKWSPSHNKDDRHCPRTPVSWGHDFSPKTAGSDSEMRSGTIGAATSAEAPMTWGDP